MSNRSRSPGNSPLPRLAAGLLSRLLPAAEREEVLDDLAVEYGERANESGWLVARLWVWRQVLSSVPALVGRGWWRGWSGFEPRANRMRPGGSMFESWAKDVKYALRRLRARPTYALLTVLTLALGVAGTAAVYGIAKRLLIEPLPYRAEGEVVAFWYAGSWSEEQFLYLRPDMEGFRNVAAYRPRDVTLTMPDAPARMIPGRAASAEFFQVLGVSPALGPGFQPGDDRPGAEPVAVLSHRLWRDLGADPGIVGQRVEMGGIQRTVVGVMPEGFWFPDPTVGVWLAAPMDPENGSGNYEIIARMPPGTTIDGMSGQIDRIVERLDERFEFQAEWDPTKNAQLTPIREYLVGDVRPALLATLAAMAVILLIACVNVSALMLGQVDSRGTELAVRTALGAGKQRILQQLVIESLVIGGLAGIVGAGLSFIGFRFLAGALPLGSLAETATVDWSVFAAAIGIAIVAATLVALAPGISVVRGDLQRRLTRSRTSGIGGRGGGLESGLVIAQVALVLLMASGAALLIRSVDKLRAIDPGLEVAGLGVVEVVVPTTTPAAQRPAMLRELIGAVEAIPGVQSAAATQKLPLRGSGDNWGIMIERDPNREPTSTSFRVVTDRYFETMGIGLLSGRGLLETDRNSTEEGIVVINQALADMYFPGMDPIGQRIGFMDRWDRIVGVVENVAERGLTDEEHPARYMLYDHVPWLLDGQTIVIRTRGRRDPVAVLDPARRAIQTTLPDVAVRELTTMDRVFTDAMGPVRQVMSLLTLLGVLALILGVVGVYGVVSHFVTRRKRDWGIRVALGMRPARVIRQVVARGGALVGAGILIGLVAFLVLARILGSFLYGVGTADPLSIAGATALLLAAGLLAAYLPARRASRIDPVLVLREQ